MMKKWTRYMLLMSVLLVQALCSCSLIDEPTNEEYADVTASLAFRVSTNRSTTRMTESVTQQTGFRGIQDLWLFPFNSDGESIGGSSSDLTNMKPVNGSLHFYLDDRSAKIPEGTTRFLCYCRAVPEDDYFVNGKINVNNVSAASTSVTTSTITFSPEQICPSTTVTVEANNIAEYLTEIAKAIPEEKKDFFRKFVNEGRPVACSSTNVGKLAAWATSNEITLPENSEGLSGYPASINLPDGAAVVKWNTTTEKFEPQTVTTTEVNINRLDRFIYPPELYYYAYSPIRTSEESQKDNYQSKTSWEELLDEYDDGYGVMNSSVHSVAIVDPLNYAVGCLQIGLVTSKTLNDAAETPKAITLDDNTTFPLTAVFVSGQYPQGYDFTPKDGTDEHIIYDKEIEGFSMRAAPSEVPASGELSNYTNTLVLQSKDGAPVRFALEFTNDSGADFEGANGIVFAGTKFYMVGTIEVTTGHTGDKDYMNRVFTKDRVTRGIVNISSLKQAYTYLPDLLDPRLEIGIKLVPEWIQATTTNVAL